MGDFDILGAAAIASPILLRQAMVLLGALLAAICVAQLAGSINPSIARSPGSRVAGYLDLEPEESALARIGRSVLRRVPILAELGRIEEHRRWLDLDDRGGVVTPEASTGLALVALAGGFLAALLVGEPWLVPLGIVGAVLSFLRTRSQADAIRRRVERALPDLSALVAAEMAAGNSPDLALERVSHFGGPLANLVRVAVEEARQGERPLFSRGGTKGALVEVVGRYDLQPVSSFAGKIDSAARTGAAGPALMQRLAQTLIILYKDRALREAEALDNKLAVPSVGFFFLPFTLMLLAPLIYPALEALQ